MCSRISVGAISRSSFWVGGWTLSSSYGQRRKSAASACLWTDRILLRCRRRKTAFSSGVTATHILLKNANGKGQLTWRPPARFKGSICNRVELRRAVRVRIATELWEGNVPESQQAVRLKIITSDKPLVRFSRELKALAAGARDEVVLEGELLP